MTVKLTGNFLATARCLIFQDGNSIAWAFNSLTNTLEANYSGAGSAGSANPSATIGLAAVNGSANTWMTSDSAPALSQGIVPTWTGLHTFTAGVAIPVGSVFTLDTHTLSLTANASVGGTNTGDQTIPTGASPTGTVGLTATAGTATTFLRSDGAPPLSQAISPIWTGNHIFAPTSGVALLVKANGGASAFEVTGNITSPTVEAYGPTAAALVDLTPDSGTFTVTATGMTTSPTGTATWSRIGKIVLLYLPLVTGTSNANTFTFTGLPAAIQPATLTQQIAAPTDTFEDASALLTFNASILITAGSGTITFLKNGSTTSWTTSGTKGLDATITFAYLLN